MDDFNGLFENEGPDGLHEIRDRTDERKLYMQELQETLKIKFVNTDFDCEISDVLFKSEPFDISLLEEYTDHDDSYQDLGTLAFQKWYKKEGKAELCKLFIVGAIEKYHSQLLDNTHSKACFSLNDYIGGFRSGRLGIFTDSFSSTRLHTNATPRLGRMLNVWLRSYFPADAGYQVATQPLGKKFPPCRNCGSIFDSTTGETIDGQVWLRLTQGPKDD